LIGKFRLPKRLQREGKGMNVEIFRPLGIYVIAAGDSPEVQSKYPVISMTAGKMILGPIEVQVESIVAVEIHGERISLHLPLRKGEGNQSIIVWDNWSLSLSLYSKWVSGLSLEQKEVLIGEVLSWEEGIEKSIYEKNRTEEGYNSDYDEARAWDKIKAS